MVRKFATGSVIGAITLLLISGAAAQQVQPEAALGAAFTYQGRLNDAGSPANGSYDFLFILYDAALGGSQVGSTVTVNDLEVVDGYLTVWLDFGAGVFTGQARWLEISVRPGGSTGSYTILSPRQPLTAAPYALFSQAAPWSGLSGVPAGFADGVDNDTITFWSLTGNSGTTPGVNYLGTSDNSALILRVNGGRALRIEPSSEGPNLIGGWWENYVTAGVRGAVIAGGGSGEFGENRVTDMFGAVGGGAFNQAGDGAGDTSDSASATVGGGYQNTAAGMESTVSGGSLNQALGDGATIGGGIYNFAYGFLATVGGGGSTESNTGNRATDSGATVGGGGNNQAGDGAGNSSDQQFATVAGGFGNLASAHSSTVAGGINNTASAQAAVVAGGDENTASAMNATVGGGILNLASGTNSTISGGTHNLASGEDSTICGGNGISATGSQATVAGGSGNTASQVAATVSGGSSNTASEFAATVSGGRANIASAWDATVGGGASNSATGEGAIVAGGGGNTASALGATVSGGDCNIASGQFSTVGGGGGGVWCTNGNLATDSFATVSGGHLNQAGDNAVTPDDQPYATVGGGYSNLAGRRAATVSGGVSNTANADYATVSGGETNQALGLYSTIGGGQGNSTLYNAATIGGGDGNIVGVNGSSGTIGGGWLNFVNGNTATIPGGAENEATGGYSFAAGAQAHATHAGSFVWSSGESTASYAERTFTVRAHGGARFYTAPGTTTGVSLAAGGGSWSSLSDRSAKENFRQVDPQLILAQLAQLPIASWNYIAQEDAIRHLGPTAQDFSALFSLGEDSAHITTVDADGVALAAIQGLYTHSQEQAARLSLLEQQSAELAAENRELKAQLSAFERRLEVVERGGGAAAPTAAGSFLPLAALAALGFGGACAWRRKAGGR